MIRGFYSASSGLVTQQSNMDTIANNIANISTSGFKPSRVDFSALLHEKIKGGAGMINMGHGVKFRSSSIDFGQGELFRTDMEYDFAIVGDGFFALEGGNKGDKVFKRDGSFQVSLSGNKSHLVDSQGRYLLDKNNNAIELGEDFDPNNIGVFKFNNPYALQLTGNNNFIETEASGKAELFKEATVKKGYLESSAVNAVGEMVKMIEASKAFSLNSKVIQTADEMEKVINQLR